MNKKPSRRSAKRKPRAKPLSLYGISFDDAVGRLLTAKPKKKKPKK
jgi:hypothetical protein